MRAFLNNAWTTFQNAFRNIPALLVYVVLFTLMMYYYSGNDVPRQKLTTYAGKLDPSNPFAKFLTHIESYYHEYLSLSFILPTFFELGSSKQSSAIVSALVPVWIYMSFFLDLHLFDIFILSLIVRLFLYAKPNQRFIFVILTGVLVATDVLAFTNRDDHPLQSTAAATAAPPAE